jgi:predicted outer membrane repeat protein
MQAGNYTPGNGLNLSASGVLITNITNVINIVGGYNADFTSTNGLSVLDARGSNMMIMNIQNSETLTFYNIGFINATNGGQGIHLANDTNISFYYITISNNNSTNNSNNPNGGGICSINSIEGTIQNCLISGNNAKNYGGGIYLSNSGYYSYFKYSSINNNVAGINGGGFYFAGSTYNIIGDCTISNNQARTNGGGIFFDQYSVPNTITMYNSISNFIVNNSAVYGTGGGIWGYTNTTQDGFYGLFLSGNTPNNISTNTGF